MLIKRTQGTPGTSKARTRMTAVFLAVVLVLAFGVPGVLCVLFVSILFPYALFHAVQPLVSP